MKYEFNVGDYVEMALGEIGYIDMVEDSKDGCYILVKYSDGGFKKYGCADEYLIDGEYSYRYERLFKRIGKYDFTGKIEKKNKIEPLEPLYNYEPIGREKMLFRKVNEVIDYINKGEGMTLWIR